MSAIDLPRARRLAFGVVLAQAVITLGAALVAVLVGGRRTGLSVLLGAGIATLGSLAMAGLTFGSERATPQRVLGAIYLGETVKVALVMGLFVAVVKWVDVAPLALFVAFAATFLVYWVALLGVRAKGGAR
ncbi:MAG: ATP synthase subunit I [Gammaproteobacteria bacterium]|nr:ATP synthase subunit I [Gammaproteobacteria bacterium]MBV9696705.1 ATP synthase subunit I [Gammaproteobacteria bacterium]